MSVELTEDGAVLQHEDCLLPLADVLQVEQGYWLEDGGMAFLIGTRFLR